MTTVQVKHHFLRVLLALLIVGAILIATVKPVLANTYTAGVDPGNVSVVNADIGVYWRSDTDWNTAI